MHEMSECTVVLGVLLRNEVLDLYCTSYNTPDGVKRAGVVCAFGEL